jgi:RNA polymerase sigma factor (sigma-70 family)
MSRAAAGIPAETAAGDPAAAFADFSRIGGERLRRAFVAAFGVETGNDVHADALAWAWEHWDRVAQMKSPVGYLFRVGQSKARRYLRWRRVVQLPTEPHRDVYEVEGDLGVVLTRLSRRQRTVVFLVHGYGWSYAEVGELLGISNASVRNHVHRGMQQLRAAMEAT